MRIVAITVSRADWNGLGMLVRALREAGNETTVVAVGWHPPDPGTPFEWVPFAAKLDQRLDIALHAGTLVQEIARRARADLAIINGDRFEALAAAYACALMGVPIAHLSGGDETEGSQDEAYRGAITELASVHLVTNFPAFRRLLIAAEQGDLIINAGDPGIDRICATPVMTRDEWLAKWSLPDNQVNPLVIFHPVTRGGDPTHGLDAMLKTLDRIEKPVKAFFFEPNGDPGWMAVRDRLQAYAADHQHWYRGNMEPADFYACMTYCDFMIGNSSAGVHEAPVFGLPVVNIGDRQKGRILARNVIQVDPTEDDIWWGIQCALAHRRIKIESPYGDGKACERIVEALRDWEKARGV